MTCFGNNGCIEHKHNERIIKNLDNKIKLLNDRRRTNRNRVKKKRINKIENRKANLRDELHWKTINRWFRRNVYKCYKHL